MMSNVVYALVPLVGENNASADTLPTAGDLMCATTCDISLATPLTHRFHHPIKTAQVQLTQLFRGEFEFQVLSLTSWWRRLLYTHHDWLHVGQVGTEAWLQHML